MSTCGASTLPQADRTPRTVLFRRIDYRFDDRVEADWRATSGKCASYKRAEAGEKAREALLETTRKAVTFATRPPSRHEALST
jgi:hypothetical protein